jgi:hypothetical protein
MQCAQALTEEFTRSVSVYSSAVDSAGPDNQS